MSPALGADAVLRLGFLRSRSRQMEPRGEEWPQVAAGDLAGRPPERLCVDRRFEASELGFHEARREAGEHEAAENGRERLRYELGSGGGRDRLRRRLRLLSGQSTLLDRE